MQDQVTAYLDEREFDIAYRRATAGGVLPSMALPDVLVAVTLAPFITAVAASLGSGLGERIETVALRILRRDATRTTARHPQPFLDVSRCRGRIW
ncbi:hypothetical protein ACFCYC_08195 [Streptomyces sp. NPDC056402]|uniref:hypothetical protein n=1 Tax=Streptomyces sp. NPDC056402 TaxID=3345810 RepID=UPI0035E0D2D2